MAFPMTVRAYAGGVQSLLNKEADVDSDAWKGTLHTAAYAANFDTDRYQSSLTNELATGGGYTNGGQALTGLSLTKTAANALGQVYATGTAYTVGEIVRPSAGNGFVYVCAVAGTSGGSAPTWPTTLFTTVADNGITWCCIGRGVVVFTFASPSWAAFSAGPFRQLVIADTTPGSAATNPLILNAAFAADQTGGGGTFTATVDPSGALVLPY